MSAPVETQLIHPLSAGSLQKQLAFEEFQGCSPRDVFSHLQSWDTGMAGQPWLWVLTSDRLQAAYEDQPDVTGSLVTAVSDHLADLLAQPDQFERNQQLTDTIISLYRDYQDHSKESIRYVKGHECVQDHLRTLVGKTLLADPNNVDLLSLEERRNLFKEANDHVSMTCQTLINSRCKTARCHLEEELRREKHKIISEDLDIQGDLLEVLSDNLPFLLYLMPLEDRRLYLLQISGWFSELNKGQLTALLDNGIPPKLLIEPDRRKPDDRQLPILVRATDAMEELLAGDPMTDYLARCYLQFPQRPPGDIKQMIGQLQRLGQAINNTHERISTDGTLTIRDLMFDRIDAVLLRIAQRYDPAYAPDNPQWRAADDRDDIGDGEHILPESNEVGRLFLTVAQYENHDLCKHLFSLCSYTGVNLRSAIAGFIQASNESDYSSATIPPGVREVMQYLDDIQSNPGVVSKGLRIETAIVSHKVWPGKYRYDHAAHIRDCDKEDIRRYLENSS